MAFGTPKPTTGFLGMGDDIEITFNENINNGRLTSTGNFIVTAALRKAGEGEASGSFQCFEDKP